MCWDDKQILYFHIFLYESSNLVCKSGYLCPHWSRMVLCAPDCSQISSQSAVFQCNGQWLCPQSSDGPHQTLDTAPPANKSGHLKLQHSRSSKDPEGMTVNTLITPWSLFGVKSTPLAANTAVVTGPSMGESRSVVMCALGHQTARL